MQEVCDIMACVGVLSSENNALFSLKRSLCALGYPEHIVRIANRCNSFDAVLIDNPPPGRHDTFTSKILIVPDCMDASAIPECFSDSVISYGLRKKNTVTVSSLIGERLAVTVQRQIPTANGNVVAEQEFPINITHGENSDKALGIISTLLVLDVPPDKIAKITF